MRLEKTFGEVRVQGFLAGAVSYKNIRMMLDPGAGSLDGVDYVFLTSLAGSQGTLSSLRKNQKILALPEAATRLARQGFSAVKGLEPGPMIQMTKDGGFLFARAVRGVSSSGEPVNGYFLEFDNGRNLYFAGGNVDAEAARRFLWGLRDEGKEIHMAFLSGGVEESVLIDMVSTLQPRVAVLVDGGPAGDMELDRLRRLLREQFFEGALFSASAFEAFPF